MEYFWLVLGILLLIWAGYNIYVGSFEEQGLLLLFPAICFAAFFFRRMLRQRLEAHQQQQKDNE